ncbi:DNA double-strand break repair rad50 ATPase [Acidilobus saccharovorans 345-15]|uniref:DNA double-strand break repair rad50 ATPase n=1 Tax=Acidilobus saccharovorans (strain DSM 16705 / JCM 18335 / VKM B-2471 / 345-15) TaxID=666510 RepID=D9Q224_ACIS3|nr:SMC family ATPase [Acidilobus saccharovorans]ADL19362.1 DNA double-strand break repair rad50 ATPase [Acidilobus saccharovorans 345-15]
MTYIISKLTLKDFLSHKDTKIELPRGSIAIVGQNGAGKTSMFEAIYYALTTNGWRGKLSNLVRTGISKAAVELVLKDIDSGSEVKAIASIEKRRQDSATSGYRLTVDGKLVASTASDYREEMAKVLGLHGVNDYKGFIDSAVIIKQGGLEEIASILAREESKRLRELVETAIGIPQLRSAAENIRSHAIRASRSDGTTIVSVEVGPRRRSEVAMMLQSVRKVRQERLSELRALEEELGKLKGEVERLEAEVKEREAKVNELCSPLGAIPELERQLKEFEQQLAGKSREAEELELKSRELERRVQEAEKAKGLASLEPQVKEVDSLNAEIAGIYRDLTALRSAVDALSDVERYENGYRRYTELRTKLEDVLRRREMELAKSLSSAEAAVSQVNLLRSQVDDIIKRLGSLVGASISASPEGLESLRQSVAKLANDLESLRRKQQELEARLGSVRQRALQLNDIVKVLGTSGEARCPVCGSPLSPERKEELLKHFDNERKGLATEERAVSEELEKVSSSISELEDRVRTVQVLEAQLERLMNSLARVKIVDVESIKRELEEVTREEKEVKDELKSLEGEYSAYVSAKNRLLSLGVKDAEAAKELRGRYESLASELKAKTDARDIAIKKLLEATGAPSYERAKNVIEDAARRVAELPSLLEQLNIVKSRLGDLASEKALLESRIGEVRAKLESLKSQATACEAERSKLNELRNAYTKLSAQLASVSSRIEQAKKEADKAYEEEQSLSKALDKLDAALGAVEALERLERTLYRRALVSLENEMNEIFRVFGLDYARVEVKETEDAFYFVVVDRQGRERPIASLSGGEQIVIALAYVLALNRMMHSNIGFLLLDEPTDMLDDERRRALVDVLGKLTEEGGLQQLIVITHHMDLVDNVDKVCSVEKGPDGVSTVKCEGD